MTKLQDVAKIAGVSTATVSRTLNNPNKVDPETRSKVEKVISSIGYERNQTARSLASRSSRTIGFLMDSFSSSYVANILEESIKLLRANDYYAIVESTGNSPRDYDEQRQRNSWQSLLNRQVDGIIILTRSVDDDATYRLVEEFPDSVIIGRTFTKDTPRCITFDNVESGRLAARCLVNRGHKKIAMLTGPLDAQDSQQRAKGFTEELKLHGIELPESHIYNGNYTHNSGRIALRKIIDSKHNYSALFAHNDVMAIGAACECHELGIEVPSQLSIIGHDDLESAQTAIPALTTIQQPLQAMSQAAATMALNFTVKASAEKSLLPKTQQHYMPTLVERASVMDIT